MTESRKFHLVVLGAFVAAVLGIVIVMWLVAVLEDGARKEPPKPAQTRQEPPTETIVAPTEIVLPVEPSPGRLDVSTESEPSYEGEKPEETPETTFSEADRGTDEFQLYLHFTDVQETYLDWRFTARYSYDNCLIPSGREVYYYGDTNYPASDNYKLAALDAYSAYKVQTFVTLSGFPGSCFADEEFALYFVRTLRERGCSWEVGLAISREESTWGMNPRARNLFGVCDPAIDMSDPVRGYCDYLDKHCGAHDTVDAVLRGYHDPGDYWDNIRELSEGIRGEMY